MRSLATGSSAFTTFFQVLPRLASVIRRMRPTWHLGALAEVNAEFLRGNRVRGLIWDVDGTLTGDRRPALAPESAGPFLLLMGMAGLRHVVLSNASEERFLQLGTMFPEMAILRAYEREGAVYYRRLQGTSDNWTRDELASRLDAGWRVIRKPNAVLVDYAIRELACGKDEVVMIGDQYLTDVAGANLAGVRSVKLPTLARETFRPVVRFSQRLERALYALLYGGAGRVA